MKRPWRIEYEGADCVETREDAIRTRRWSAPAGTLEARWVLGPDGDWWQTEYPVKSAEDLPVAAAILRTRRYVVDAGAGGEGECPAMELPMQPWSEILHSFIGWAEGLMIALDEPEWMGELSAILEDSHATLLGELGASPEPVCLSPDNLDGNFISPDLFEERLAPSYARTAGFLHARGKRLVVHVGGNCRGLLASLARCGADCVEGVCGPPQGDASITAARALAGDRMTLWGGLAQDWLLPDSDEAGFREACDAALAEVLSDGNAVLGVADRVPADAVEARLRHLATLAP